MSQDRFVKLMLVVIAVLLAANLFRPSERAGSLIESSARAQTAVQGNLVIPVGGFKVTDLSEVVAVGDGQSFVVANRNGFQVYRVEGTTGTPRVNR